MSDSTSRTGTRTFTSTDAKRLASKVAADLMRVHRLYKGVPAENEIKQYEIEIAEMLKDKYLDTVMYGFRRPSGVFIPPTLKYEVDDLRGAAGMNDDPGVIQPRCDVGDASFGSYMTYSSIWSDLSSKEKEAVIKNSPFVRCNGEELSMDGYIARDHTYSSGGVALNRYTLR